MEPIARHITYETTGKILGYRDLVKMDAPVWKNSMCNKLGRISQGWKAYAGTDTIKFISQKKINRREKYVGAVCNIQPQKTETHKTILTVGGNLIDYPGDVSTPASELSTMKRHVNSTISDITSRYMCMGVERFYLNKQMDRDEYIMIGISMIPQEFVENIISHKNHKIDKYMQV